MTDANDALLFCEMFTRIEACYNWSGKWKAFRGEEQMKSVTAHMLEYTLKIRFDGNRSECARRLSIRRPDFNRIYDRCVNEGGSSLKVIESILLLYRTEGYSIDEAMEGYANSGGELAPLSVARPVCASMTSMIRAKIKTASIEADRKAQVLRSASQFMAQLEQAFCTEGCMQRGHCSPDCPCQLFCEFVNKLNDQFNKQGEQTLPEERAERVAK